ncbi:LINE-1 retrotransposable element ORF2 protein [Linum grandiflorum]
MKPHILSWNVRGINSDRKRYRIKKWISKWKTQIICLQETKVPALSPSYWAFISSFYSFDFAGIDSDGASGGLVTIWNSSKFRKRSEVVGLFSTGVILEGVDSSFLCGIINVYGPNERNDRISFIAEIASCLYNFGSIPFCILGDFNLVRSELDYIGRARTYSDFSPLNDFIFDHELIDLPLIGANFTWSNLRVSPSLSRIDRALVNSLFEQAFQECRLVALSRVCSDHRAIILKCDDLPIVKRPWRFENMWCSHQDFANCVADWWAEPLSEASRMARFQKKLKRVKERLKIWNKDCFGRVEDNISRITNEIGILDEKEEVATLSNQDRINRCSLKVDLDHWWKMEETSWRQKLKMLWLKLGDRNTHFFHRSANARKRNNWIERIVVENHLFSGHEEVAPAIVNHFIQFFNEPLALDRPFPTALTFKRINEDMMASLTSPFTEEEIWLGIKDSDGDKAPGPDGFSMHFIKKCWPFLKADLLEALWDFQSTSKL